jgi:hypothetical protein
MSTLKIISFLFLHTLMGLLNLSQAPLSPLGLDFGVLVSDLYLPVLARTLSSQVREKLLLHHP